MPHKRPHKNKTGKKTSFFSINTIKSQIKWVTNTLMSI